MLRTIPLAAVLATAVLAQSPLSTPYAGSYSLGAGMTFYVDVVLATALTFQQVDVNSNSTVGTVGSLEVRWTPGSYVGNAANAAAWTLGGTGPATAAGTNQPTTCSISPFSLPAGSYGLAITYVGLGGIYPPGNGTAGVPGGGTNQTFANAEITMLCGATSQGSPGATICCDPRVFSGALHYAIGGSGTIATRTPYGNGCYQRYGSFYEFFATSSGFDLSNTGITMLPNGSGYVVLPGITSYVAPTAAATTLTLADDGETAVALSSPFAYPGGSTTSLTVCSNGYVSVANGNGVTWTPSIATFLGAPQTAWRNWHDHNPTAAGSGQVKFEQAGGIAYVTWDGVYDYLAGGGQTAANANTFQFQFDTATGMVHLVFQTISALGNARLVGYSVAGPSLDPGNADLSVAVPATFQVAAGDTAPLALAASARPLLGTTIDLVTANPSNPNLGVNFLSLARIPAPGVDLGVLGAPGCAALIDASAAIGNVIGNVGPTSMSIALPIPNVTALEGMAIYSQSVWLDATANVFGMLTSNGVELVLGNL